MLVVSRGRELQGQLHWLSMRVGEGGVCRNSQGHGQSILDRLRRQWWSDLGRAEWTKSSEHQWNGHGVKNMVFWKWCEWAEKRGLGQRVTVTADFLGFCTVTLCVALSTHCSPPLGCSPNTLLWVSAQSQWRADSAQPDGFHRAVGPGRFELFQWLLTLWSRASGVQGKLPPDSHSGQGWAENMSQGICLKSYLKQQTTGQGAVSSLTAREHTQLVGGWKWWSG